MDPDDIPPPPRASQIAHDRLRRKRERMAAQAKAEADAALPPVSGLPPSTTVGSLTTSSTITSVSGLSLAEHGNQASSSALQLNLPGPLSPLNTVYPGGIPTSTSGYLQANTTTDLTRQTSAVPSSIGLTPSERRRQKEEAGQAIGIEDEIEWGDEEDTLDRLGGEVEVAGFPNAGLTLSSPHSRTSSTDTSSGPGPSSARFRSKSKWDPHVPREKDEAGGRFQVIKPDGFRYGSMGVDARWKKEKKKEERKEMVGKLFGRGKKGREGEERKREAWEDELEGKSRMHTGSKEQSLHPSHPTSSKVSLPSSQSQPIRGILRQPGQPRRIISSTTAPDLSRSQVDLPKPSPATQTTQLSSISGLPASSYASGNSPAYDLHTPLLDDEPGRENMGYPLPPARTPSGHLPAAKTSADKRKDDIERSEGSGTALANPGIYSYITNAVEQLSSPSPQPIPHFVPGLGMTNMDRRPSLASSGAGSAGPNATQTSFHSATESELFFSSSAPAPINRPQLGRAGSSFDTLQPQAVRMQPAATSSSTALPLITPEQLLPYRPQDSRYPSILPRGNAGIMPNNKFSKPYLDLPTGWNPNRRPSDSTVYLTPARSDALGRSGRSVSETSLVNLSSSAPPASRYVAPASNKIMDPLPDTRTGDSPYSERSSEYSFRSLASATRESLGLLYPATEPVPRTRAFPHPPPGVVSSSSITALPPAPSRQPVQASTPTKSFFSRSTSALTLSRKKPQDTIVEYFNSVDPVHPDVAFRIPVQDRESRMETFFPYSKSTSRDILHAILPEAPTTLVRIETIKRIQTTANVRVHLPPPDLSRKSRPGTAASLLPPLPTEPGNNGVEKVWPAQWKKMILVCTSFTFDGTKNKSAPTKGHGREGTAGPEQTVAHLHLFDPDPDTSSASSSSKVRRPKTSDTFGGSSTAFGRGFGGYIPDNERLETDRRPLMFGVKVVIGEVVDLGDKREKVEEGTDLVERRMRRKTIWFGWGKTDGWFVEFKDEAEMDQWAGFVRATLRRIGQERLELSATLISDRMRISETRRRSLNPLQATRSPEDHIAHHLSLGHSIWDPRTNPPTSPSGPLADKWAWEAYEHPLLKPLREKDKLETFDQMACGKIGWREWLWPVPPGKEVHKGKKHEKRVEGRRRRRKKIKANLAQRNRAGKGKVVEKKSSDRSNLSSLAADAVLLEKQLDPTRLERSADPSQSTRPTLAPRQSWSTVRTTHSGRSSLSAYSQYTFQSAESAGSDSTVRSGATFGGRPPTSGQRSRPGTANRQLPPPAYPPPTAPLPPVPTSGSGSEGSSRTHSRATSESAYSTDKTPLAISLHMFPTPPSTSPPSAGSGPASTNRPQHPPSAFQTPLPPRIHASSPPATSTPLVQAYPQPNVRNESLGPRSVQIPLGMPVSALNAGLGSGEAGRSTVSLASTASGTSASIGGGSLLGPGARRRRPKTPAIDLAGEIKQIDDAREAEIRAAEAAAADAAEPIDEDRPRAIRFA